MAAPGLVQVHDKYISRGVAFVSLTDLPRPFAESFADEFDIPWPSGYGMPTATIEALGVRRVGWSSPGLDIAPVLLLLGTDGRVLWSDGAARFHHRDTGALMDDLAAAIDAALAGG